MQMTDSTGVEIAIIGMACRFPGAPSPAAFWQLLLRGGHAVRPLSDEEMILAGVPIEDVLDADRVKAGAVLDDVFAFDPAFFAMADTEASAIDPQQRLFLLCAWEAFEDGGYVPGSEASGRTGVFAGAMHNTFFTHHVLPSIDTLVPQLGEPLVIMSNQPDFLPTRVSYKLNLHGPSLAVSTACSTSLVATHLACRSLLTEECDLALAGGVAIGFPTHAGYRLYGDTNGAISRDGYCRAFDCDAGGMVPSGGVGVVLLKRLDDALRDRDHIHAVIRGSAINNDGNRKVGFLAPSVEGQASAIRAAMDMAETDADRIAFIEAHGTGTPLGDPIEVQALKEAFGTTAVPGSCALGSVKSNIGHAMEAAGVAGLIKAALAVRERVLPATLHFQAANPELGLDGSPFFVAGQPVDWRADSRQLVAGVSSFGLGGTNAHVVLAQPPVAAVLPFGRPEVLLPLSARTPVQLAAMCERLADHLASLNDDARLPDISWTLQVGRQAFGCRAAVAAHDTASAVAGLRAAARRHPTPAARDATLAFFVPDDGPRPAGLAQALYASEPSYRAEVDQLLSDHATAALRGWFIGAGSAAENPALFTFVTHLALGRLWLRWGVRPRETAGRGAGALVAATLAGAISPAEALARAAGHFGPTGDSPLPSPGNGPVLFLSDAALPDTALVLQLHLADGFGAVASDRILPSLTLPPGTPAQRLLATLGRLWERGTAPDWAAFHGSDNRTRVPLPTYPFEHRICRPPAMATVAPGRRPAPSAPSVSAPVAVPDGEQSIMDMVTGLWQELLGCDVVPLDSSFFDLGGDSLLAFRLANGLRDMFGIEIRPRDMFEAATVRTQAARVEMRLLAKLETMSAEEMAALVAE